MRDPLGVWGLRLGVTGDATGGSIKVQYDVRSLERSAYIYTWISAQMVQLTGVIPTTNVKFRILTNWPNIDRNIPGVQGYGSWTTVPVIGEADFTAPVAGPSLPLVHAIDRYLLCFDPQQQITLGVLPLGEIEWGDNTDGATYSIEGYGYFWDRSVLNAPGGLRHPGSS